MSRFYLIIESSQAFSENEEEIDAENSYYKILKK